MPISGVKCPRCGVYYVFAHNLLTEVFDSMTTSEWRKYKNEQGTGLRMG
jgi:uncharacterized OB-fold protein